MPLLRMFLAQRDCAMTTPEQSSFDGGPSFDDLMKWATTVVHVKYAPYDVYIGRPSKWGNPFIIGRDGTRLEVIALYKAHILGRPELLAALPELKGKVLGCYCAPKPCHGDVLAELAELGPAEGEL